MDTFTDELTLDFTDYSQLSFLDEGNEEILLFLNGNFVGYVLVYTDV